MIRKPYLLFLGDVDSEPNAKTAFGVRDWLPGETIGQARLPGCRVDLGLPDLTPAEAAELGARSLLIGVAPVGGALPPAWTTALVDALNAGLDLVSGLHTRLSDVPDIAQAAKRLGRDLHDIRHTDRRFPPASGHKRSGKRLLTVGTDCALGKKYTALAIARAMKAQGMDAEFRATGQTGIMISGDGIAMDAVVSDFIAGAAECLTPDAQDDHWDIIEGQGALFHPAFAGVTLGLLHGSQPDAMVLCHDPSRTSIHLYPAYPLPTLNIAIARYEEAARLTNPAAQVVGLSLNTSKISGPAAERLMGDLQEAHGLPCFDPLRSDLGPLIERLSHL